ncbi:hypothetical protein [Streptomyces sp. GbtcB6]|uniref:hypothetical protein n=1 Tax=Streptomyces sp. GbtcB6 TaxID=2824751 RepID=UPI001C3056F0|nr:hypothetical protein [Streptomyces sp. GbtcB6]
MILAHARQRSMPSNAHLLAATVADALGVSDHTPRPPADAIRAWIGGRVSICSLL